MPRLILLTLLVFAEAYLGDILIKIPYCDQEHFELKHLRSITALTACWQVNSFSAYIGYNLQVN